MRSGRLMNTVRISTPAAGAIATGVILLAMAALVLQGCGGRGASSRPGDSASTTPPREKAGDTSTGVTKADGKADSGPSADESAGAVEAARADAARNNPGVGELDVLAVRVDDSWARVDMQPADRSADAASWLLNKQGGSWRVVDFGTTILPADHPDAPAGVFR